MLWCVIYLCCLVVAGYALVAPLGKGRTRIETLALSLCLGPGVIGLCLIFLSMLGLRPGRAEILLLTAPLATAAVYFLSRKRMAPVLPVAGITAVGKWWTWLCLLLIGYGLVSVGTDALVYPTLEWDAFSIWQLKAKVLAFWPLHPRPAYFQIPALSYSHLRYPLLLPMISAGVDAMIGTLSDLAKAPNFLFYGAMGGAVYAAIRCRRGRLVAITATALLMCLYVMYRYAGTGTAEMALTAFYACSILCLLHWQQRGQCSDLILLALFSACMAWTKNEGLALAAINAFLVLAMTPGAWRRRIGATALLAAIMGVLYTPWLLYIRGLPRTDEDYAARLNLPTIVANLHRLPQILFALGLELVNWNDWGLFWMVLALLAIMQFRRFRQRQVFTVGLLLLLHLLAYLPPYMVVPNWNLKELLAVTTDRLLLHTAPAAAILIGLLWPDWLLDSAPAAPALTLPPGPGQFTTSP